MLPPCHDLIKEFSTRTVVPVELDDVEAAVLKRGVKDEIYCFLECDFDTTVLLGALSEWFYTVGAEKKYVAQIDVAKSLPIAWKRLVVCKELLHLLDEEEMKVSTAEEFEKLTSSIGLPPEDQYSEKVGHKTVSDRVGTYKAVAVLFPWATREIFLEPYKQGKLSYEDIARIVDIPARYAALVMDDGWAQLHEILMKDYSEG